MIDIFFILFIGIQINAAILLTICHLLSINILVSHAIVGGVIMTILLYFMIRWTWRLFGGIG